MIDSKNPAEQSGSFNLFTLAVAAVAMCGVGTAVLLAPAEATTRISASTAYAGPAGYFPDQFVNQAKEIEPMPEMYY
jgi:hypothetical protein